MMPKSFRNNILPGAKIISPKCACLSSALSSQLLSFVGASSSILSQGCPTNYVPRKFRPCLLSGSCLVNDRGWVLEI